MGDVVHRYPRLRRLRGRWLTGYFLDQTESKLNEGMGFVLLEFVLIGLVLMDFSLVDIVSESNPNRCMDNISHALGNRIDQIYRTIACPRIQRANDT